MISIQAYRISIGTFNYRGNKHISLPCKYKSRISFSKSSIFILYLIFSGLFTASSYDYICKKNRNKNMHILNGNISKNGSYFYQLGIKGIVYLII